MLDCDDIQSSIDRFKGCSSTEEGLRVATDCLLPSFEQLHVYVVRFGDGFIVHDGCAAARSAWIHGADHQSIKADIRAAAKSYSCRIEDNQISLRAPSVDWLWSAVAAVANASAEAARRAVESIQADKEKSLIKIAQKAVEAGTPRARIKRNVPYSGASGRSYNFDLAVWQDANIALIDAVTPHPASIAFKHLAFSEIDLGPSGFKFVIHDGTLEGPEKVLLSGVADVVMMTDAKKDGWNVFA